MNVRRGWEKNILLLFIVGSFVIMGCEKNIPEPGLATDIRNLTYEEKTLISQSNQLAFKMMENFHQSHPDKNIFFSPLTIGMAMGMMYNGVEDSHKLHFNTISGFDGSEMQVNKAFSELTQLLQKLDDNVQINLSNSFWHDRKLVMNDLYKDKIMAYYAAEAEGINFGSIHSSQYINRLVSSKIKKTIDRVNYPLNNDYQALMINAVSFSGMWSYPADALFKNMSFNGKTADYEFIPNATVGIYENMDFRLIDIPYGKGFFSMTLLIPEKNNILPTLNYQELDHYIKTSDSTRLDLYLPLITANQKFDMLQFFNQNDLQHSFSSMFIGASPKFDVIMHDSHLDPPTRQAPVPVVNNKISPENSHNLIVDQPFLYFIREKHTGMILFAGKFLYPES